MAHSKYVRMRGFLGGDRLPAERVNRGPPYFGETLNRAAGVRSYDVPLAYRGESTYSHLGNRAKDPVSKPNDLVQGTLDLLVLKMLAFEPMNGWAIGQRLKQLSADVLQVSDGSLYPALHKLEQEGWVTAEWRPSENNRRAKFYSLTRAGRKQLQVEAGNWDRLARAITAVVR